MNNERYIVDLSDEERARLLELIKKGNAPARKITRARILLSVDRGDDDKTVAQALHVSARTVQRTRKRFAQERLGPALNERPRPGAKRRLDGKAEAFLIALACSQAPEGRERWAVRLLADRMVEMKVVPEISRETVRRVLKGGRSNPG